MSGVCVSVGGRLVRVPEDRIAAYSWVVPPDRSRNDFVALAAELVAMFRRRGPCLSDWRLSEQAWRLVLLRELGNPSTCVVWSEDRATGNLAPIADLANLSWSPDASSC